MYEKAGTRDLHAPTARILLTVWRFTRVRKARTNLSRTQGAGPSGSGESGNCSIVSDISFNHERIIIAKSYCHARIHRELHARHEHPQPRCRRLDKTPVHQSLPANVQRKPQAKIATDRT